MENVVANLAPDAEAFSRHFGLVQDYVLARPGALSALMKEAEADPTRVTASIVSLGAVLLDVAAGAFHLDPAAMLEKVGAMVTELSDGHGDGSA